MFEKFHQFSNSLREEKKNILIKFGFNSKLSFLDFGFDSINSSWSIKSSDGYDYLCIFDDYLRIIEKHSFEEYICFQIIETNFEQETEFFLFFKLKNEIFEKDETAQKK